MSKMDMPKKAVFIVVIIVISLIVIKFNQEDILSGDQATGQITFTSQPAGPHTRITPSPPCGDGVCAPGEIPCSCPTDCPTPACGSSWGNLVEMWEARAGHGTVVHNGKMFVIGGSGNNLFRFQDAWSSTDGVHWQKLSTTPFTFSTGWGDNAVSFNGKIWIIRSNERKVYSSPDGINWALETSTPQFPALFGSRAAVLNGKIFLMGGTTGGGTSTVNHNDVWSSTNGINWVQETANAGWPGRGHQAVIRHDNKLWVMGGNSYNGVSFVYFNDVWSSSDGITWSQATASAGWFRRAGLGVVAFNNKMWVMGGSHETAGTFNDIWSSSDGITWTQVPPSGSLWDPRYSFGALSYNNHLWMMGGQAVYQGGIVKNDIWQTQP